MNREQLKALIDEIIDLKFRADGYSSGTPVRAIPLPPASERTLSALESHLARADLVLPKSYRMLLSICDGIESFFDDPDMNLLSAGQVAKGTFNKTAEDFPHLSTFVIAAGDTAEFISFDTSTGDVKNEYEVVHINAEGDEYRVANLITFLTYSLDYYKNVLEMAQADREDLADD